MVKTLQLKLVLLLCLLVVGVSNAWADTYTIGWGTASGDNSKNFTTAEYGTVTNILRWDANKEGAGTAPAYNANASELRLYYGSGGNGNGGSITITPVSGVTITGFVMTTSTSPSVNYTVDEGTATSVSASSNTYTVTGISATSSLMIQNVNTSNTQLRIKTIEFTYTTSGTPATTYTVTYDANGGTGTMTDSNNPYSAGATVTVLDNEFTRTNYDFVKWNTASDGSGTNYDEGDTFTINANTTLYAQWTENSGSGTGGSEQWVLTNLADLTSSDVFVIVGTLSETNYSMSNDGGTTNPPAATAVTISNNEITSTVAANIQWNISGNATDGYTFYPNGSTTTWLYCTATNNGVRVGTNTNKAFELNNDGYLVNKATSRVLSHYGGQWRCYGNTNNSPLVVSFYKKVTSGTPTPSISAENVDIAYNATGGNISYTLSNEPDPAGTLTAAVASGATISNFALGTITGSTVPFTCDANTTGSERTATVTLTYTYGNNETVTKNVTVTQAAAPVIYTTIPALFDKATEVGNTATNVNVTFGNWVVSGVNGSNAFVTDNDGNGFIIYTSNHGFAVNDKLSGTVSGTPLKLYNGSAEFTNLTASAEGLNVTNDGVITVITNKTIAELGGVNTGAVITLSNLSYDGTNLTDGTNNIKPYNTLYSDMSLTSGKTYNITGVYQQYNNTKEILPRSAADIVEVVSSTPSITAENVNIAADATLGSIAYTINNEVSGGVLTASVPTNSWLNLGTDDGSAIAFTCLANTGAARTETVTLTYTYNTNETVTKDVSVTQAAYVAGPTGANYVRITSLDQLIDGSFVVIAARYNTTANEYYAMSNSSSGKPTGTLFTSITSNSNEILPSSIVENENNYYWVVNVTTNGYTFTNVNGEKIGYTSSTNFATGGDNTEWTIGRNTSASTAMVTNYLGFLISNKNNTGRSFALNESHNFGPYSNVTGNMSGNDAYKYNFFLDFFVQPQTVPVTIKANFPATTFSTDKALDFTNVSGVKAYIITSATGTTQQVTQVPANTGLYIEGTAGTYNVPVIASADPLTVTNLLEPTTGSAVTNDGTYTYYVYGKQNDHCAFYKVDVSYTPSVNKAVLKVPTGQAKDFIDVNGGATAIDNLQWTIDNSEVNGIYDLQGRRVAQPTKGIYIVNGKKVVVK